MVPRAFSVALMNALRYMSGWPARYCSNTSAVTLGGCFGQTYSSPAFTIALVGLIAATSSRNALSMLATPVLLIGAFGNMRASSAHVWPEKSADCGPILV